MSSKKWEVLNSAVLLKGTFFKLRADECKLPNGRIMPKYYVMELLDWVNIVAITDKKVIMIQQYRHACDETFLEIPGGTTDSHKETPLAAAKRELLEETGYVSENWIYKGFHCPNPAIQNNKMHTFLALDCKKKAEQDLDPYEDITVELHDSNKIIEMLKNGQIYHSLISASLVRCLDELVGVK
jgi:8-oxo-dGTP pyrophosphatase MutT (NUDIX family)